MSNEDNLHEVREKLNELLEAARTGAIIPVRLPGQIEEIADLLAKSAEADAEADNERGDSADMPMTGDAAEIVKAHAQFISIAVHELRTPMTSIRGYADMLPSMGELSDMQKQFVETIRTNARRMEGLLADVSNITKIRARTLKISLKMDMFKNIAMGLEKQANKLAEELNRQTEFNIPDGLPLLNTDGEFLTMAFMKHIENALRYSADGEGKVTVTGAADGSTLVVTIEDNGIGIEPDILQRLGELYLRGENDTVREFKGSGLGVPIALGIIEMLGGETTIESEVGQGTKVTIRHPGMV